MLYRVTLIYRAIAIFYFSHMRCLQESGVSCEYSLGTLTDTRTAVLNRTFIPEKSISLSYYCIIKLFQNAFYLFCLDINKRIVL